MTSSEPRVAAARGARPKIALATCAALPGGWDDDQEVARVAGAEFAVWDDPAVDWEAYDRVVLRSVWDYSRRAEEFLTWCAAIGPNRLRNPPDLVAFDADKRYLGALGVRIPRPVSSAPATPCPSWSARWSSSPTSRPAPATPAASGLRSTPRRWSWSSGSRASGRVAIVQSYLADVDRNGEMALVFIAGQLSHVLRKRPVLRGEGEAPLGDGPLGAAAVMSEADLVAVVTETVRERR